MGDTLTSCLKFFFLSLNILLLLIGVAALAGGIYIAVAPDHFLRFTEIGMGGLGEVGLVRTAGYLLIAAGGVVVLIAGLGILAGCKESACLYVLYGVILMITMGCCVAAFILGLIFKSEFENSLKEEVREKITLRFDGKANSDDIFTAAMNVFQTEFDCCGVNNSSDFESALKWNRTTADGFTKMVIPPSCCYDYSANNTCTVTPTDSNSYASRGCWSKIQELMETYSLLLIIIAAIAFGLQLFLIMLSICLVAKLRSGYDLKK